MDPKQTFGLTASVALLTMLGLGLSAEDDGAARNESAEFAHYLWIRQSSDDAFALAHSEPTKAIILQHVVGNHFLYWARTQSEIKDLKSDAKADAFFGRPDIKKSLLTVNTTDPLQLLPKYTVDDAGNSLIYSGLLPKASPQITKVLEDKGRYMQLAREYHNYLHR